MTRSARTTGLRSVLVGAWRRFGFGAPARGTAPTLALHAHRQGHAPAYDVVQVPTGHLVAQELLGFLQLGHERAIDDQPERIALGVQRLEIGPRLSWARWWGDALVTLLSRPGATWRGR